MISADVAVIGGGVAGLSAARKLTAAGLEVHVIEARDRAGGRVLTIRDPSLTVPVELGAEFVHGSAESTLSLVRDAGLTIADINGDRWESGRRRLRALDEFWEELDAVMGRLTTRRRDRSFEEFLADKPGGRKARRARTLASQWVRGFHAADPGRASANALADGGSPGDDESERRQGRILEGYSRVVDHLLAELRQPPRTSTVVTTVRWAPGEVELTLRPRAEPTREQTVRARTVIVAVPIGVLQTPPGVEGAILFDPPLPSSANDAMRGLAEGHVVRVSVVFDEPFWLRKPPRGVPAERAHRLAFIHPGSHEMPVCWTSYPADAPLLVAWYGGPDAFALSGRPRDEIEAKAVSDVAKRLHLPRRAFERHIRAVHMHNWTTDPFSRGAYSYVVVGGGKAATTLSRPIDGTLFLAGEAFDAEGRNGTVDGAIASGERAASQVVRAVG